MIRICDEMEQTYQYNFRKCPKQQNLNLNVIMFALCLQIVITLIHMENRGTCFIQNIVLLNSLGLCDHAKAIQANDVLCFFVWVAMAYDAL